MTIAQLRTYINATFTANGLGNIDGTELRDTMLEVCDRIEASGSWVPVFSLVTNGANVVAKITDWTGGQGTKPTINVYLYGSGYTADINLATNLKGSQGIQGTPGNGLVTVTTLPGDGLAATRYYPVCTFGVGGADFAQVELVVKPLDSTNHDPIHVSLYITLRAGLKYEYTCAGPMNVGIGLVAYVDGTGNNLTVYIKSTDQGKYLTVRVTHFGGTVYSSLTGQNSITGTLVFDSTNSTTYPPLTQLNTGSETMSVGGRLKVKGLTSTGTAPVGTAGGGGLGTAGTLTVLWGDDMCYRVRLVTGSSPTANQQYGYVNFSTTYAAAPRFTQLTPRNGAAAKEIAKFYVKDNTAGAQNIFPNGTDAPTAGTTFEFDVFNIF